MPNRTFVTAALLSSASIIAPATAHAQQADQAAIREELAQMRAAMDAMNNRIQQLEGELANARAEQAETAATLAAIPPAPVPTPAPAAKEDEVKIAWKGAPQFSQGDWSFKLRGRVNIDAGHLSAPESTGHNEGFSSEARRVRLGAEGDIPGGFGYKIEYDFAPGESVLADAMLTYEDKGLTISIGHQNNFQSLEELSSSRFLSFVERAAFTDAFNFERRIGISAQYTKGDVLLQAGAFSDNITALPDKNAGGDARIVYMPKFGNTQLHFGGSLHYTDIDPNNGSVRYRQRPLEHPTSTRFINTGNFSADSETGYGAEFAAINGRFHATGEAYWQSVQRTGFEDPLFFGAYAEVGFFLTPDTRPYKKGVFDRVKPSNPVNKGGMGAWQVNLRYDYLDLNDADIIGGQQNLYGVSLVWTPTDYTRFLLNYAHIKYDDAVYPTASGATSYGVDSFGARAQVDF